MEVPLYLRVFGNVEIEWKNKYGAKRHVEIPCFSRKRANVLLNAK